VVPMGSQAWNSVLERKALTAAWESYQHAGADLIVWGGLDMRWGRCCCRVLAKSHRPKLWNSLWVCPQLLGRAWKLGHPSTRPRTIFTQCAIHLLCL
jgi:hypothetical protein